MSTEDIISTLATRQSVKISRQKCVKLENTQTDDLQALNSTFKHIR